MDRDADLSGCTRSTSASTSTSMLFAVGSEAEEFESQSSESSAVHFLKNRDLVVCLCGAGSEDPAESSRRVGTYLFLCLAQKEKSLPIVDYVLAMFLSLMGD